jgi:transcriptional regulator with XRE-family HTH domain
MMETRLRRWRRETGMTQQQLAEKLGVTQSVVSRWERGIETPGFRMIRRIEGLVAGADILSGLHRELAGMRTLSIGRALFDLDGLRLLGASHGFARQWPQTHGGATLDTIQGVPLLDRVTGEVGAVLQDDETLYRMRCMEYVALSCVTERSTDLEIAHGIRYRTHGAVRRIGAQTVLDVTYETVSPEVPLGLETAITIEDVMKGGAGSDIAPPQGCTRDIRR